VSLLVIFVQVVSYKSQATNRKLQIASYKSQAPQQHASQYGFRVRTFPVPLQLRRLIRPPGLVQRNLPLCIIVRKYHGLTLRLDKRRQVARHEASLRLKINPLLVIPFTLPLVLRAARCSLQGPARARVLGARLALLRCCHLPRRDRGAPLCAAPGLDGLF
jgi:hypothetical protein